MSLIKKSSSVIAILIAFLLLTYNLRRLVFSFTALISKKSKNEPSGASDDQSLPEVLILVPCRDEEKMVPGLCNALKQLDYPEEKLQIVLINDGSHDNTGRVFENYAAGKNDWHLYSLLQNIGKANALNAAMEHFTFGDIIIVYDADHRPEPESLRLMVRNFEDDLVAGVSGKTIAVNGLASPSAYYSMIESMVHQMVTMRAKDRLGLAPALLGSNCGYRRSSLEACGRFTPGALLEDSDLTLAFYRSGYRIRFAEDAIAYHQVPETVTGYLKQHIRWGRGFNNVSTQHLSAVLQDNKLTIPLKTELALFSTGYIDRVALLGAVGLTLLQSLSNRAFYFPVWALVVAMITPLVQIIALLIEQHSPISFWRRLPLIPVFFLLDIYAAFRSTIGTILNQPQVWSKTERI